MDDHTFDLENDPDIEQHLNLDHDSHTHDHDHDHHHTQNHEDVAAEAVLASLRAVINDPNPRTSHNNVNNVDPNDKHPFDDTHQPSQNILDDIDINIGNEEGILQDSQPNQGESNVHDIPNSQSQQQPQNDTETLHDYAAQEQGTPLNQEKNDNTSSSVNHVNEALLMIVEKGLSSLNEQMSKNKLVLDQLNSPNAIQNLVQNLKSLGEGNKKGIELLGDLNRQVQCFKTIALGEGRASYLSTFAAKEAFKTLPFVLRSEYDMLKRSHDNLVDDKKPKRSKSAKKDEQPNVDGTKQTAKDKRQSKSLREVVKETISQDDANQSYGTEGRKKRSIKLEHLVHQKANQRLGVEYLVSNFISKGSMDLPDPNSTPPKAENSMNGVDEFAPEFKADLNSSNVKPFIDQVVEDCLEALKGGLGDEEPDIDREKITSAVHIYWTRLCKRYDEQLHRERGEVHRDELSRRKQNRYRRQQSLLARRLAAFDSSPLNVCKLRALYRTLLTIDFAAPTQNSPDPTRSYTENEWNAYRKLACGSRASEAHEVIDQFWLSSMARQLLTILDVFSADMNARARKKGKPKQPNPTFHLPSHYWDRSTLPIIRPKDSEGLPVDDAPGIVLFRFHVDEQVQRENPEWAEGLYDNPPIPEGDINLPSLPEGLSMGIYTPLRPLIKTAKEKANPKVLSAEEVEEINSSDYKVDDAVKITQSMIDTATLSANLGLDVNESNDNSGPANRNEADYATLLALNRLDVLSPSVNADITEINSPSNAQTPISTSVSPLPQTTSSTTDPTVATNQGLHHELNHPFTIPGGGSNPLVGLTGITEHTAGPSPGSSMRARKLNKRTVSQVPGGAATPVAKRLKKDRPMSITSSIPQTSSTLINSISISNGMDLINDHLDENEFITGNTDTTPNDNSHSDIITSEQQTDTDQNQIQPDNDDQDDSDNDALVESEVQGDATFLDNL
ncbi:uncharacterized protein L201_000842 [Kwoniella dendrophila CBS 6074]|uniref:Uncharacterized protein n=1 Tax=Kwoniella dendrophila CBS 6074 TaxID=1295534 RepID=A0AAX4JKN6_9TREE